MWVENELREGRSHSEIDMAAKVDSMRAAMEKYVDLRWVATVLRLLFAPKL